MGDAITFTTISALHQSEKNMRTQWKAALLIVIGAFMSSGWAYAQRSCQILPVNTAPESTVTAVDDIDEFPSSPGPKRINVLSNDRGPAGAVLRVTAVQSPTQSNRGSVAITSDGSAILYMPFSLGGTSGDSFTYTVSAGTASATARVTLRQLGLTFAFDCEGIGCSFWPLSSDPAAVQSYAWNWGDGSPVVQTAASQSSIAHFFPPCSQSPCPTLSATYNVQLTSISGTSTTSVTRPVFLTDAQLYWRASVTNGLAAELEILLPLDNLNGTATFTTYIDWGDGTPTAIVGTPNMQNVPTGPHLAAHTYARPGAYTAQLSVQRMAPSGTTIFDRARVIIAQNAPPVADFWYSASPQGDHTYRFVSSATDESQFTLQGTWDLAGHVVPYAPGQFAEHRLFGRRVIRFTVTDEFGLSSTAERTIDFPNAPPSVDSIRTECTDGLNCTFEAIGGQDDSGTVASYRWNFGDGSEGESTAPTITHQFASYAPYGVTVTPDDGSARGVARRTRATPNQVSTGGVRFFALPPCEIYDSAKSAILSDAVVEVSLIASPCAIPPTASAVALNATVTRATGGGFLQVGADASSFGSASLLNFTSSNVPRSNAALAAASDGRLYFKASVAPESAGGLGNISLRVEATGYFAPDDKSPGEGIGPLAFEPLMPARRLIDTRNEATPLYGSTPAFVTFSDPATGQPLAASAVMGNLTAIAPTAGGSLLMYPAWISRPSSMFSSMSVSGAADQAGNFVTSLAEPAQAGLLFTPKDPKSTTHVAIDASGYYSSSGRLRYYPLNPCRAIDSRDSFQADLGGSFPGWRVFPLKGNCGVPASAEGVFGVITVVGPSSRGWGKVGASLALDTSNINFRSGEGAVANGGYFSNGATSNDISIWMSAFTHVIVDVYGYFASPTPVTGSAASTEN